MYRDNSNSYMYKHFWKTKESIIQGHPEKIRVVEQKQQKLNVDWTRDRMLCGLIAKKAMEKKELCIYPDCFNCAYGAEI